MFGEHEMLISEFDGIFCIAFRVITFISYIISKVTYQKMYSK